MYDDNNSVLYNSSTLYSVLKGEINSIGCYHTGEGSTCDEWRITYIHKFDILADSQTKPLPYGEQILNFCIILLKHIYGYAKHVEMRVVGGFMRL